VRRFQVIKKYFVQCTGIFIAFSILIGLGDLIAGNILIAPFGATCAILFVFPDTKFARLRNVIGGYSICALVGVAASHILGGSPWIIAFAASMSIFLMMVTGLMHPPAGAVTIVAITTGAGWGFILEPVVMGALIIVIISIVFNRIWDRIKAGRGEMSVE
jgi:CBS-domain-containing membrane protein